jgi:hypothetical protein
MDNLTYRDEIPVMIGVFIKSRAHAGAARDYLAGVG